MENFREIADRIASDIGPVDAVSIEEAHMLARCQFPNARQDVIAGVADALYRSYRCEMAEHDGAPVRCRNGTWVQPIHRAKPRNFVKRGVMRLNRRPE